MKKEPSGAEKMFGGFAPKLVELTDNVLFGEVWERSELSKRDRSLVTVAALVALKSPGAIAVSFTERGQERGGRAGVDRTHYTPRFLRRLAQRDELYGGGKRAIYENGGELIVRPLPVQANRLTKQCSEARAALISSSGLITTSCQQPRAHSPAVADLVSRQVRKR